MDFITSIIDLIKYMCIKHESLTCSICWSNINIDNDNCTLLCGHKFHTSCIVTWSCKIHHKNDCKNKCPICRKNITEEKENVLSPQAIQDNARRFVIYIIQATMRMLRYMTTLFINIVDDIMDELFFNF